MRPDSATQASSSRTNKETAMEQVKMTVLYTGKAPVEMPGTELFDKF